MPFDYFLGERDGVELLSEAIEKGCKTPVIVLTAMEDHEVAEEAMSAGAADYLPKGEAAPGHLLESIRGAIAGGRSRH